MPKKSSAAKVSQPWQQTSAFQRLQKSRFGDAKRRALATEYRERFGKKGARSATAWLQQQIHPTLRPRSAAAPAAEPKPTPKPPTRRPPRRTPSTSAGKESRAMATAESKPRKTGSRKVDRELARTKDLLKRARNRGSGGGRGRRPSGIMETIQAHTTQLAMAAAVGWFATQLADGREVMGIPWEAAGGVLLAGAKPEYIEAASAAIGVGVSNYKLRQALMSKDPKAVAAALAPHLKALENKGDEGKQQALLLKQQFGIAGSSESRGALAAIGRHSSL